MYDVHILMLYLCLYLLRCDAALNERLCLLTLEVYLLLSVVYLLQEPKRFDTSTTIRLVFTFLATGLVHPTYHDLSLTSRCYICPFVPSTANQLHLVGCGLFFKAGFDAMSFGPLRMWGSRSEFRDKVEQRYPKFETAKIRYIGGQVVEGFPDPSIPSPTVRRLAFSGHVRFESWGAAIHSQKT